MSGWTDVCMYGWTAGQMDGWMRLAEESDLLSVILSPALGGRTNPWLQAGHLVLVPQSALGHLHSAWPWGEGKEAGCLGTLFKTTKCQPVFLRARYFLVDSPLMKLLPLIQCQSSEEKS